MKFGSTFEELKMSDTKPVLPMATARRAVRTRPRTRDNRVPAAMIALERAALGAIFVSAIVTLCSHFHRGVLKPDGAAGIRRPYR
ncbi:hypothetical protein GCM10017708_22980 [Arthrobacter citreus]